ncbi:oxidoreductase [Thiohalobacter thiocyanaticus]|uniref:Oxidoreductase n=1 Tax=Thiohalobacter thiocyanaticus TaxID=585455 RepID=A0A426QMT2_9GAMM|nr:oxidoreductase [Thiohalobacter thiocyanaticus]
MSALAALPWDAVLILLPLTGAVAAGLWPRSARPIGLLVSAGGIPILVGLGTAVAGTDGLHHAVGGWGAPLGIELRADALSLVFLATTALVGLGVALYADSYFEPTLARWFWPLWLFLLGALNALFLSADLFNLYVTLELMGLAAVALTALGGGRAALTGAMRYLLATLLGSLVYLLGVALLYHATGTLDFGLLGQRLEAGPASRTALGLMGAGLALKTALFPFHFWLPPAHASAPAPVSALLSALVVKASFYILVRLWLELFAPLAATAATGQVLGLLGMAAILWGSWQALRQPRVKLLVAYSTVAQIGYLFLAFPLLSAAGLPDAAAWRAVLWLVLAHALAKAAMFLAAGNLLRFGGHDRITDLDCVAQRLPLTVAAFALAGVSIAGLPPTGGFIGKWLLLEAALLQGRWDLVTVMLLGGLLAAGYVFKVVGHFFTPAATRHEAQRVPARMEWTALGLAVLALLLGLAPGILLPWFDSAVVMPMAGARQ